MRDQFIQNIAHVLPKRDESLLFDVLDSEYHNVNQVVAGLEAESKYYVEQIKIDQQKYEVAYRSHDERLTAFHQAKVLNDRFEQLDQKEEQLKKEQAQIPQFTKREEQLAAAERASKIDLHEKQVADWRIEEKTKQHRLATAETAKKTVSKNLLIADENYKQQEQKQDQRDEVSKRLEQLNGHLPVVKDIEERKKHLFQMATKGKQTAKDLEDVKATLADKQKAIDKYNEEIKEMDHAVSKLPEKQQTLQEMRDKVKLLMAYHRLMNEQITLDKDVQATKQISEQVKATYLKAEKSWLNNQASILANHLHDGEACPVCGSVDHPNKATINKEIITKEQLEIIKRDYDEKDTLYRNAVAGLKNKQLQREEKEQELLAMNIPLSDTSQVEKELVDRGTRLDKRGRAIKETTRTATAIKGFFRKSDS